MVLATFGVVVGVLISFCNRRSDEEFGRLTGTSFPSQTPTPFDIKEFIDAYLPQDTQELMLAPGSPQAKAIDSLVNNYSSAARKVQRIVLATLYYSTQGPFFWAGMDGWGTPADECEWQQQVSSTALLGVHGHCRVLSPLNLAGNGPTKSVS